MVQKKVLYDRDQNRVSARSLDEVLHEITHFFALKQFNGQTDAMKVTPQGFLFLESDTGTLRTLCKHFLTGSEEALDMGSGNGIAVAFFSRFAKHVTGIEIASREEHSAVNQLFEIGMENIELLARRGLVDRDKITLKKGDYFDGDLSKYDFIYMYWPYKNEQSEHYARRLEDKLARELRPGAIFVLNTNGIDPKFTQLEEVPIDYEKTGIPKDVRAFRARQIETRV